MTLPVSASREAAPSFPPVLLLGLHAMFGQKTTNLVLKRKPAMVLLLPPRHGMNDYSAGATMYCSSFPSGMVKVQTRRVFFGKTSR